MSRTAAKHRVVVGTRQRIGAVWFNPAANGWIRRTGPKRFDITLVDAR